MNNKSSQFILVVAAFFRIFTIVANILNHGCSQTIGVVPQLPPASGTCLHPLAACSTQDVSGWTTRNGEFSGNVQADRALEPLLKLALKTGGGGLKVLQVDHLFRHFCLRARRKNQNFLASLVEVN